MTERVTPTEGEVKLDNGGFNPRYSARSVDGEIPEGTEVMVIDPGGGNVVTVESVSTGYDDIDRELARGRNEETERVDGRETEASEAETGDPEDGTGDGGRLRPPLGAGVERHPAFHNGHYFVGGFCARVRTRQPPTVPPGRLAGRYRRRRWLSTAN